MQTDADWMCLNCLYVNLVGLPLLSQEEEQKAKIRHWPIILHAILIEGGFFKRGETCADLKCEGKEPSVSDKLIIDGIGIIKMSILQ